MSQSKLQSGQTNIDELKAQTAMVERQLAEIQENKEDIDVCYCQKRLLIFAERLAEQEQRLAEQEKRLAEQEKYQQEKDLLLLRVQTAGWFAVGQCEQCVKCVTALAFALHQGAVDPRDVVTSEAEASKRSLLC